MIRAVFAIGVISALWFAAGFLAAGLYRRWKSDRTYTLRGEMLTVAARAYCGLERLPRESDRRLRKRCLKLMQCPPLGKP